LIVHDNDRLTALKKLERKLQEYSIVGLKTNIPFLLALCRHESFINADVHTDFIPEHEESLFKDIGLKLTETETIQGCLTRVLIEQAKNMKTARHPFMKSGPFRVNQPAARVIQFVAEGELYDNQVIYNKDGTFTINGVPASGALLKDPENPEVNFQLSWKIGHPENEQRGRLLIVPNKNNTSFDTFDHTTGRTNEFSTYEESFVNKVIEMEGGGDNSAGSATAPMTGTIDQVLIKDGVEVKQGDNVIIMIAMKMEHAIKAPKDGVIERVLYQVGQTAEKGSVLIKYQEEEE